MTTRVIIRADDITSTSLRRLGSWFTNNHPDVPCAVFAMNTHDAWGPKGWQTAQALIEQYGWEVGGHTREHPKLSLLSDRSIVKAIRSNVEDIERGLRGVGMSYDVTSFAYPCGDHDDRVIEAAKHEGLSCGLTYPDGFPYTSVSECPTGDDRYRWGVTHTGKFDLHVWNNRFDRVERKDGLYVLCIHPTEWMFPSPSLLLDVVEREVTTSHVLKQVGRLVLSPPELARWRTLDAHLNYVKQADDVEFTTFRDIVRE